MSNDATQLAERRIAAAQAAGLPTDAAERLRGTTDAELEADATRLADERPTDMNSWIRRQAGR